MGCSASTTVPAVDEEIHLSKVLHDRAEFEKERAHRYRLSEETLGQGAFGVVYAAVSENSKLSRAIKILPITSSKGHGAGPDEELLDEAKKEVAVWAEAGSHPNIVELLRSYVEAGKYCMVMDRCDGGSLGDRKTAFMSYPDHEVARVFREMLFGISHIHSRNIIHRDIKPSNFLYGGPRSQTVKLADFGLATTEENGGLLWGCYGTPPYMSPEMAAKRGHHRSTDIWSLGASCYLLLFGEYPYLPVDVSEGKSKAFKAPAGGPSTAREAAAPSAAWIRPHRRSRGQTLRTSTSTTTTTTTAPLLSEKLRLRPVLGACRRPRAFGKQTDPPALRRCPLSRTSRFRRKLKIRLASAASHLPFQ